MKPSTAISLRGICGIYAWIHRDSGMCYVGSSVDIGTRIGQHLRDATGRNSTTLIHKAIREFGADSFDVDLLRECKKEDLVKEEEFYIALLGGASVDGFNISDTPSSGWRGLKASDATLARRSASLKGKKRSPEFIAGAILRSTGKKHTEETKAKISAIKKAAVTPAIREHAAVIWRGKKIPEELVKRRAASATGRKRTDEFKEAQRIRSTGRRHSQETIDGIRATKLGTKMTEEACKNMSASRLGKKRGPYKMDPNKIHGNTGKKASKELCRKRSEALIGKPQSAETQDKKRTSMAAFHARRRAALMACEI